MQTSIDLLYEIEAFLSFNIQPSINDIKALKDSIKKHLEVVSEPRALNTGNHAKEFIEMNPFFMLKTRIQIYTAMENYLRSYHSGASPFNQMNEFEMSVISDCKRLISISDAHGLDYDCIENLVNMYLSIKGKP